MASPSEPEARPVVFVTGASRGIGRACAERFAAAGWAVAVNSTTEAGARHTATALETRFDVPTLAAAADAADDKAVEACYRSIFQRFRRLDALVHAAGMLCDGAIGMIASAGARRVFEVNALGTLYHLQAASRLMRRRGQGSIVTLASIMGEGGAVGASAYAATKAAVASLTRSAALELGPHGIRVNAIAPGMIETDMLSSLSPAMRAARVATIPQGRVGTPAEVAELALFLASAQAGYINGQVIGVDGGMP